jgi:hypothetical protein
MKQHPYIGKNIEIGGYRKKRNTYSYWLITDRLMKKENCLSDKSPYVYLPDVIFSLVNRDGNVFYLNEELITKDGETLKCKTKFLSDDIFNVITLQDRYKSGFTIELNLYSEYVDMYYKIQRHDFVEPWIIKKDKIIKSYL